MPRGWKKNAKGGSVTKREKAGGNSYKKNKLKKNIDIKGDEDKVNGFKVYKTLKEKRISENAKLSRTQAPLRVFNTWTEYYDDISVGRDKWRKKKLKANKHWAKGPRNLGSTPKARYYRKNTKMCSATMSLYRKKLKNENGTIKVGDVVKVKLENWIKSYKGEVIKDHGNKTYKILFYDDGNIISESNISSEEITLLMSKNDIDKPSVGDRVKVKLAKCDKLHKGKVLEDHNNGYLKILFHEGDVKSNVDINNITLLSETKTKSRNKKIKKIIKHDSDDEQKEQECSTVNNRFYNPKKYFILDQRNRGDWTIKRERRKLDYDRRQKRIVEIRERKEREKEQEERKKFWERIAEILKEEEEEEENSAGDEKDFISIGSYPPTLKRQISEDGKCLIKRALSLDKITEEATEQAEQGEQEEEDNLDVDYAGNVTLNIEEGWLLL